MWCDRSQAIRWTPCVLLAIIVVSALGLTGCGGSGGGGSINKEATASLYTAWPLSGKPVRGGTATIDAYETPSTFNPFIDVAGLWQVSQVFDTMFEYMPGAPTGAAQQPKLVPGLVSSYSVSSDHLTYTFHVREGVKFSNGEPLTGEDIVFSLEQDKQPTAAYLPYTKRWKQISLAGPMTVKLHLSRPQVALPELLTAWQFAIVSKHAFEREGAKGFGLHPVGTGPFMIKSATPGFDSITMVRNPHYWRAGLPYLNGIVFNVVQNDNQRILAVRSGQATISQGIPYPQVASLKSTPGVKMLVGPEWGASLNVFNRAKAPLKQNGVRRALLLATPREQIIKSVYRGLGSPPNSLWGEIKYENHNVPLFPYDIAKAKQELATSSVPHGFNITISVSSGETGGEQLASILQNAWAQIGVHASIQTLPTTTLISNFYSGKYEFAIFPPEAGFSELYSPEIAFYVDNSEPGWAPPANAHTVSLLKQAETSVSESEREKLYGEIQYKTYWTEPMAQMITTLVSLNLVSDKLHGFQEMPSTDVRMDRMWLQER